jgi:AcrR family transcriptional regulator
MTADDLVIERVGGQALADDKSTRDVADGLDGGVPLPANHGTSRNADDTASKLVAAAAEVFAEKGYDGAGVAEIARRAGLTTGAIYSRFTGKAELLAEAIHHRSLDQLDLLLAQGAFRGRATDLLEVVGTHLVVDGASKDTPLLVEAFAAARRHPEVADMLKGHVALRRRQLADLVEESKASGLVDPEIDTEAVVHFAHAVGLGFVLFSALDTPNPDASGWQELIHRLVGAVGSPATATGTDPATPSNSDVPANPSTSQ